MLKSRIGVFFLLFVLLETVSVQHLIAYKVIKIGFSNGDFHFRYSTDDELVVDLAKNGTKENSLEDCMELCTKRQGCKGGLFQGYDGGCVLTADLKLNEGPKEFHSAKQTSFFLVESVKEKECKNKFSELVKERSSDPSSASHDQD
uniref:Apple domain-containing protein n=1 Tax=Steinernema glaseri TaxID=37863 RepID=A0A1I7YV95_9BILA